MYSPQNQPDIYPPPPPPHQQQHQQQPQQPDIFPPYQQQPPVQQQQQMSPPSQMFSQDMYPQHQQQYAYQMPQVQMLADPMVAAAVTGGQNLVNTSSGWIDRNLRPLFDVNDSYVLLKLSYLLFPFRPWQSSVAKPDLYIPLMSFITYVLGAGYLLGLKNQFSPEKLGMISSSALFCVGIEVALMAILFSVFNVGLSFLCFVAFSGYKFVPIIWAMMAGLFFKSTGYYLTIAYTTLSLGYYLVRSCHKATMEKSFNHDENRKGIYLSGIFGLLQPLIMFWLSYHLVPA